MALPELLYSGELEKWSNTARGETWRKFTVKVTNKSIRWNVPTEIKDDVYLGEIEVCRIINAKIDPKSPHKTQDYTVFIVQVPNKTHEFRTETPAAASEWVQQIKNATLPKTRRVKKENANNNNQSNGSTAETDRGRSQSGQASEKTGYVNEIHGGIHIERPSDSGETTSTDSPMYLPPRESHTSDVDTDNSSENPTFERKNVVREGYLIKQGNTVKNWKRRWFTLTKSYLTYREEEGSLPKGRISIDDVVISRKSQKFPEKKFLFEVITKKRVYYIEASSQDEMDGWTSALTSVLTNTFNGSDASSLNSNY